MPVDTLTIAELERWVLFGADWQLVRRESNDHALASYLRSAQPERA
jgi:hypothetical protein